MKKFVFLAGLFLTIMSSCQSEEDITPPVVDNSFNIEELSGIEHNIAVNILAEKFGGYKKGQPATRAISSFTLTLIPPIGLMELEYII